MWYAIAAAGGFAIGLVAGLWQAVFLLRRNTRALQQAREHIQDQRQQIEALQEHVFCCREPREIKR